MKHTTDPTDKENLRTALDAMRVSGHRCVLSQHVLALLLTETFLASPVFLQDLAQSVNEVKRDNEIIRQITTFQLSIENMVSSRLERLSCGLPLVLPSVFLTTSVRSPSSQTQSLALFGRPKIDGELKICSQEKRSKQDR